MLLGSGSMHGRNGRVGFVTLATPKRPWKSRSGDDGAAVSSTEIMDDMVVSLLRVASASAFLLHKEKGNKKQPFPLGGGSGQQLGKTILRRRNLEQEYPLFLAAISVRFAAF